MHPILGERTTTHNIKQTERRLEKLVIWIGVFLFATLNKVKQEIKENFPYKYMYVETAEADDIIAVLTKHAPFGEKVLIVSGDKDFQQLHKYGYVKQWSPNVNKMIHCEDPYLFLKEHILSGDKSDGIPNILSSDTCLDEGIRQTPLRKPIKDSYLKTPIEKTINTIVTI